MCCLRVDQIAAPKCLSKQKGCTVNDQEIGHIPIAAADGFSSLNCTRLNGNECALPSASVKPADIKIV